ncbi:MAG: hypothetical protein ACOC0A_03845 [Planctomycetota bacterium]
MTFTVSDEHGVEHVVSATAKGDNTISGESPVFTAQSKEPVGLIAY